MNKKKFQIFLLFLFCTSISHALDFSDYIDSLYLKNRSKIEKKVQPVVDNIINDIGIENENTIEKIEELLFLHFLFTTTDALNGQTGGILKIPYFWHWVNPNPRYDITYKSKTKKLKEIPPPKGYQKYKSYADIDRTPYIYIDNLLQEDPLFYHPYCDTFYTFGWCSEREMAFTCILNILGYASKIKQEGIHVWSEVLLNKKYSIKIDNTFNGFQMKKIPTSIATWKNDFGDGAQVNWYNKKANSKSEIDKVRNLDVKENVAKRIQDQINDWIQE